jgi:guanine deaminase
MKTRTGKFSGKQPALIYDRVMCLPPEDFMRQTVALAVDSVKIHKGGPFGALVVNDNRVIATGINLVTSSNDPTAHAEVVAIRAACQALGSFQLAGCEIYCSCEPCPMCLGAIYWARLDRCYFSATRQDAAAASFDDSLLYDELTLAPEQRSIPGICVRIEERLRPFAEWAKSADRISY